MAPLDQRLSAFTCAPAGADDTGERDTRPLRPDDSPGLRDTTAAIGTVDDELTASCAAPRTLLDELREGQSVGDFHLLQLLGRGGAGRVFLARQRSMQRMVALKISLRRGAESIALAQLDHANIVRVYDERSLADTGLQLLYMRYVPGGTLHDVISAATDVAPPERSGATFTAVVRERLRARGLDEAGRDALLAPLTELSWTELVCRVGAQLADALDYAHRRGVVHRDIKPANILLDADGTPMLADFNISSWMAAEDGAAGLFGGSPGYMSPEQERAWEQNLSADEIDIDGKTDIYSLGVTLWELLFGQRPRQDDLELARRLTLAGDEHALDVELTRLLLRCLDADRDRRPDGQTLAHELQLLLQPEVKALFRGHARGARRWIRRWPRATLLAAAMVPNALAGVFNFAYNRQEIVDHLANAQQAFWNIQTVINGIAFPLGLGLLLVLARPLVRALRYERNPGDADADPHGPARRRALQLGHLAAVVGVAEWLVAGIAYPLSLSALTGSVPASAFVHFATSLALCGLIAAAYPFFFIGCAAVGTFAPALSPAIAHAGRTSDRSTRTADLAALAHLETRANVYLLLAGAVPLLAVSLIVVTGRQQSFALGILSGAGLLGFGLAFAMHRHLHRRIAIIRTAIAALAQRS